MQKKKVPVSLTVSPRRHVAPLSFCGSLAVDFKGLCTSLEQKERVYLTRIFAWGRA